MCTCMCACVCVKRERKTKESPGGHQLLGQGEGGQHLGSFQQSNNRTRPRSSAEQQAHLEYVMRERESNMNDWRVSYHREFGTMSYSDRPTNTPLSNQERRRRRRSKGGANCTPPRLSRRWRCPPHGACCRGRLKKRKEI